VDDLEKTAISLKRKSTDKSRTVGILVADESFSFLLSFQSYNNLTNGGKLDVFSDRMVIADYGQNKKIIIKIENPLILT
jgi:hypothetical protein